MKRYRAERRSAPKRASQGFTLVEVMIAIAILTIALLGVAATTAIQSGGIAGTFPFGQAAVTRGYYLSTATMLAQDRLERVKRLKYTLSTDEYGVGPSPAGFPDEGLGAIPGYPNFSRQVRFSNDVPAANIKLVTVTMTFTLPTERGANQESMKISTLVAARP